MPAGLETRFAVRKPSIPHPLSHGCSLKTPNRMHGKNVKTTDILAQKIQGSASFPCRGQLVVEERMKSRW